MARVQLVGELVNLRPSRARVYFELRDSTGAIPCATWLEDWETISARAGGAPAEGMQIVVAGQRGQPETEKLLSVIRRRYIPNKVVLLADGGDGQHWLTQHIEALRPIGPVQGKSAAYVCRNFTCDLPITEPEQLARLLESL